MQIILLEKIANVGNLGDIVKVKDGYARNFLIPEGKAKRATAENITMLEGKRTELERAAGEKLAVAQAQGEKLAGLMVQITQKAGVDGRLFGSVTNGDIAEALKAARLGDLAGRLNEEEAWSARLSGGEQQRLAVARALLARPDWLFLDVATSALDEPLEKALYAMLAERLPHTTIVSIGHRSTLIDMHDRRLDMRPSGSGLFSPQEVAQPAAA
jgi:ribosomal protein L9